MHLGKKYRERNQDGWSDIKSLGESYESFRIMRLTSSLKGTYVLDEATRDGGGSIRYSQLINGKRESPRPLDKTINTGKWNAHPFIAPDESYIMWDGERDGGFGGNDIYISFKQTDGSWGTAVNLGSEINTDDEDSSPYVTPDGKYLFFNRYKNTGNGDIYWVDAKVLEPLRARSKPAKETFALSGPYLGQEPPGTTAKPFAPNLITTSRFEVTGVFTPDLQEFYYIRGDMNNKNQEFVVFKNLDNQWHESVISKRVGTPLFSPDGKTMHLGTRYMQRNGNNWSEIKHLDSPVKDVPIMRLSASSKGTYFFDEFKTDFTGDILYSRLINGKHETPKLLNNKINTGKSFHPFVAPDESYLIFDSTREGGHGDSDLYISYRQPDDSWGEPINLGDKINSKNWEAVASVTPDGKYLFFNRRISRGKDDNLPNVDIYWVDAQFIEELRPKTKT